MKTMIIALAMAASLGTAAVPAFARGGGGGGGNGTPFVDPNGFPPGFFDGTPGKPRIVQQENAMAAAEQPHGEMFQVPNSSRTPTTTTPTAPSAAQG
jgi:hypothetical protein